MLTIFIRYHINPNLLFPGINGDDFTYVTKARDIVSPNKTKAFVRYSLSFDKLHQPVGEDY